jgi:GT2 family glycosyltransferase
MKLSIVIVNYNVSYFLEQCLFSVAQAIENIEAEVWVVDNASVDNSVSMVKEKFPWVKLIESKDNLGFSKGNNLAIHQCEGEYILLLNPDTVVEEDTFSKCIHYMDQHPDVGGLGVKMLDGNGHFLPESKRGLPTPIVSLYKIIGLSSLFPRSERFAKYYLGHLSNEETHEIEILSGAYMFMRKSVLDQVGVLDEAFFMYGEDIDLSYRIIKGGYKNVYYPETRIIHYKGESTKKGSINYVLIFYQAMIIFANKHFSIRNAKLYHSIINLAIYFRAGVAILSRFIRKTIIPAIDIVTMLAILYLVKNAYEDYSSKTYQNDLISVAFISYALIWTLSIYFSGGYDKPVKFKKIFSGLAIGTLLILTIYALLPEDLRFSRAIILLGSAGVLSGFVLSRLLFSLLQIKGYSMFASKVKRFAIVGSVDEVERVSSIIRQTNRSPYTITKVSPDDDFENAEFVGSIDQLKDIVTIYKINELIFCAKNLSSQVIISSMSALDPGTNCKIAPPESLYIIGSNSVESATDLYMLDVNAINRVNNKRTKRSIDIIFSLVFILFSPLLIFIVKAKANFIRNLFQVLIGKKSWVGYAPVPANNSHSLPYIKKGVLNPISNLPVSNDPAFNTKMNIIYAKDYKASSDIGIILKGLKQLGN